MKHLLLVCIAIAAFNITACNDSNDTKTTTDTTAKTEESNEERNIRTIKASMEGINQGNPDVVMRDAAPDFTDHMDGSMPSVNNMDSLKMMMKGWMGAFPDFKCSNQEYFADGDKVVVISDCSGTWKNDYMGAKATNKSFKYKDTDIFTFNDKGQVTSHRSIQAMGPVMGSVGMQMPDMPKDK